MDVDGLWVPRDLVQHIQDMDTTVRLCQLCPGVRVNRVQWARARLEGKRLKGRKGSRAAIMFAYSSGELEHLLALIPCRFKKSKFHMSVDVLKSRKSYFGRMTTFRQIMWIPMCHHARYIQDV